VRRFTEEIAMNGKRCHFIIAEDGATSEARNACYGSDDRLNVMDLTTRACLAIRAAEVSIYRHTLLLNGQAFRILNMTMH
jgi:hypothetical protein